MIIKHKSLVVALTSSFVIFLVLVLTLASYLIYIELKNDEFRRSYDELLAKTGAKAYSKYIVASKLNAEIESGGALKGDPVIAGEIKNAGSRNIFAILVKVKFVDPDGASIYEVIFNPQEPALGGPNLPQVSIPYISASTKPVLKSGESLSFKKMLYGCPKEIASALKERAGFSKNAGKWSGKLELEPVLLEFKR